MNDSSFHVFPEVSSKLWKQKIQFELQGDDYNRNLIWKNPEGIDVKPFYHPDDFTTPIFDTINTGSAKGCFKIHVHNAAKANQKVRQIVNNQIESIYFIVYSEQIDVEVLFAEIAQENIDFHIEIKFLSINYIEKLQNFIAENKIKIYLYIDIIDHLTQNGNWFYNLEKDFKILHEIINISLPFKSVLSVNTLQYHNAGANIVQQLAYTMAHANEYLNFINNSDLLQDSVKGENGKNLYFSFKIATGPDFFFEIAKIKALRILWKTLSNHYNLKSDCHIIAFPSYRHQTLLKNSLNKTRNSTSCLIAFLGGADTVCNVPHDLFYQKEHTISENEAMNVLTELKHKKIKGLKGSFYVETITEQLAQKALQLFKQIEKGGGFLNQLKNHTIQKKIKESAEIEQREFNENYLTFYKNSEIVDKIEINPFLKKVSRKTIIQPVIQKRLSEDYEKLQIR